MKNKSAKKKVKKNWKSEKEKKNALWINSEFSVGEQ
jgi:hypothetical protein